MSRLRVEEKIKKEIAQDEDTILQIGKEGKEGDKYFKEHQKEEDKASKEKRDNVLTLLETERKNKTAYNSFLANLLMERVRTTLELPQGWSTKIAPSTRGVVFELNSPGGRTFRTAFAPTVDPIFDLNAIELTCVRAENTIERIEGQRIIV